MSVKSCKSDHIEGSKGPEIGEYLKDLMDNCTPETGYFYFLFYFLFIDIVSLIQYHLYIQIKNNVVHKKT